MWLIFQYLIVSVLISLAFLVLKPLYPIIKYKLQYGNQVYCYYFPLIGFNREIRKGEREHGNPYHCIEQLMKSRPHIKMIVSNLGFRTWFALVSPDIIKAMMINNIKNYKKYSPIYMNEITDRGIFTVDGPKWQFQRFHLSQNFHFGELQEQFSMIRQVIQTELEKEFEESGEREKLIGKVAKTGGMGKRISTEVGIRFIFGESIGTDRVVHGLSFPNFLAEIMYMIFNISRFSQNFLLQLAFFGNQKTIFWLTEEQRKLLDLFQEFKVATTQILNKKIETLQQKESEDNLTPSTPKKEGMIDQYIRIYLEHKQRPPAIPQQTVNFDELVQQTLHLQLGAADNTGSTIGFIIYNLARYPEHAAKVKEEVDQIVPDLQKFNFDSLSQMDVCYKFIKETMRQFSHPHGTLNTREAIQNDSLDGIGIKQGSLISIIRKAPDCNPKYYEDPLKFDMERWNYEGDRNQVHIFTPFSSGPHNCLGQHLAIITFQIFLVLFLQQFTIALNPKVELQLKMGLQIQPVDDNLVILQPIMS